jgi:hypothetical protein
MAKQILIQAHLRAFAGNVFEVPDDFDLDDGDAVEKLWNEQVDYNEALTEMLELNLEASDVDEPVGL